jgi:hypothetical protein
MKVTVNETALIIMGKKEDTLCIILGTFTASVVEGLESMTSNPVDSLAWVRSPGDALVV